MSRFKDHFSVAGGYGQFRPSYPDELFDYLAEQAPGRELVLECATGSGQAAGPLAARFDRVVALDASLAQLSRRRPFGRVGYAAARAEATPIADRTVDLLTVSQALHWFALDSFFAEVDRVLVPGGVVAAWSYDTLRIDSEVDALVDHLHNDVVGPYWPPEREYVDSRYEAMPFPFERLAPPALEMSAEWTRDRLVGYVGTWSAVNRYRRAIGEDPMPLFERQLESVWPRPEESRRTTWCLTTLVGTAKR